LKFVYFGNDAPYPTTFYDLMSEEALRVALSGGNKADLGGLEELLSTFMGMGAEGGEAGGSP
jgi:hypothetical protein